MKEKNVKEKKSGQFLHKGSYAACMIGTAALIIAAFFGPQLVYKVQDAYLMEQTWQGPRNSLDLETLYGSYGNLRDRLTAFAERKDDMEFHVTGTEYSVTQELLNILELAVSQECFSFLEILGIGVPLLVEKGYTVEQWKQYVIYNDSSEEEKPAVLLSGWYIELTARGNVTLKLLIDTESYELYYMQMDKGNFTWSKYLKTLYKEELFTLQDYLMEYWFEYYEAGETPVQTYEHYRETVAEPEVEYMENLTDSIKMSKSAEYMLWKMEMNLPYLEKFLKWEMKAETVYPTDETEQENPGQFSMGLADIAALIPELAGN